MNNLSIPEQEAKNVKRSGGPTPSFSCPDCGHRMLVKRTCNGGVTHYRIKFYQCSNLPDCGSSFKGGEELTHRLINKGGPRAEEAPL